MALSRERIVDAAIALLDDEGEEGLTFRALATRLETGAGAIYWHIANKHELLVAAADTVFGHAMADVGATATPHDAIRALAAGVFDAVDAHPWIGPQLTDSPPPDVQLRLFERIGQQLDEAPESAQFTAASTLVSYIVGMSVQNAANARSRKPDGPRDRTEFLTNEASRWKKLAADAFPFTRRMAGQLRTHDDRAEFLAGVDLILGGIAMSGSSNRSRRPKRRLEP